jgi:hypothetical protein
MQVQLISVSARNEDDAAIRAAAESASDEIDATGSAGTVT